MVDAPDLKSVSLGCLGSSPSEGTMLYNAHIIAYLEWKIMMCRIHIPLIKNPPQIVTLKGN